MMEISFEEAIILTDVVGPLAKGKYNITDWEQVYLETHTHSLTHSLTHTHTRTQI